MYGNYTKTVKNLDMTAQNLIVSFFNLFPT